MTAVKIIGYFALALTFVLSAVFLSNIISNKSGQTLPPAPTPVRPLVTCPPDFISYSAFVQNDGQTAELIGERKPMFAADGKFVNSTIVITKNETEKSKVACGYLFVRAGTGTNGALQSWENVYINPNEFGGHMIPSNTPGDAREYSEYLFSLDKIQYWKTRNRKSVLTADWAALLNVANQVSFHVALNTEDRSGFIDEITVSYKCWDPKTGEENQNCKLDVTNRTDEESVQPVQ